MTEQPSPPVRRRILRNLVLWFCLFCVVAFAGMGWYVTTDSFQRWMRNRVIVALERITGGRVELRALHSVPFRLRVEARNLIIHGSEAAGQEPFLQVERVEAEMKIISLLSTTIGLHSLVLEHPVVHIINYPDGTTNVPLPQVRAAPAQSSLEKLSSLSVSHVEVKRGEALWEDKKIPFSFSGHDLSVLLNYSLLHRRYEAHLSAGAIRTEWSAWLPFDWGMDAALALSRGRIDVSNLTVKSGKTELHFSGQIEDFRDPHIKGEYRGLLDLGEWARVTRQAELRNGTAQFSGKGSWSLRDFATQGTLQTKDVAWASQKVSVRNGRVDAVFDLTPVRLRVSSFKGYVLGGTISGDVEVTNWQSSLEASGTSRRQVGKTAAQNLQHGSARVQMSGFPLAPALAILSTKKIPLDRLALAGLGNGTVDTTWVETIRDAEARFKLDIVAPSRPEPNVVPIHGQAEGIYRGSRDELELSTLHLITPGSDLSASGNLSATSSLHFTLTTHNPNEWRPLMEAACGSSNLPFLIHGWATFTGNASGRLSAVALNGNLEAYDVDTTVPSVTGHPPQVVHWDAISTGLQFSQDSFSARNGSVVHGHTVGHFDLSAGLSAGVLAEDGPFTLHVDLLNADMAELAKIGGVNRPVTGVLGLSMNASGMRSDPHGDGHFEVRDGTAYGVAVPTLKGDIRLSHGETQFNNLEARIFEAKIAGSVAIDNTGRQFRANLTGHDLELSRLPQLQTSHFTIDGTVDFTARAAGTTDDPSLEAHVSTKNLALDQQPLGTFYLDAVTRGRQVDIQAHSEFKHSGLILNGTIGTEKDFPADLTVQLSQLDLVALLGLYFPGKLTGSSPADAVIHIRGPLRMPAQIKALAEVPTLSAEVGHVRVANVEPIRIELTDQTLLIENFHVAGSGTDFTAHGSMQLAGQREMDLNLDGTVNLTLLQSLNPKMLARGSLGVTLSATGTRDAPVLRGRLEVKNGALSHNDFPSGLSDLNGVLLLDRNRFQIESLTGTTGGGSISLSGSSTYQNGVFLLDLGATARDVRLRYPPGVSSTANADLRLTGTSNSAMLSGDVVVTKLAITPGFDFGAYIERSKQTIVFSKTDSLASRLRLDVHVTTTPDLQMQTAIAKLSGDADLRLRGTAERPVVLGRVEVLEGEISFNGTKYRLERGDVTFSNPAKTQPIIDLQASTRVRDYDITVRFRGDASAPNGLKVTWQSEPQLPEADVIALLALGRTREEAANASQSGGPFGFGGEASNLLINEALNTAVSSRVQRLFGVSRIKIDPQGLANATNVVRGPQLTVEQQVASNLTVTYSTNVSVSSQQIIQVEYNVTRNISLVALRDQNGVVSFDFKIRRRRK